MAAAPLPTEAEKLGQMLAEAIESDDDGKAKQAVMGITIYALSTLGRIANSLEKIAERHGA